jgi:hypothetical protein
MTRTEVPRAPRYAVTLGMRYRQGRRMPWLQGTTENIGTSGVLFLADRVLQPNTPVEMNFIMPPQIAGPAQTRVICFGRVVRTVPPSSPDARPALAATIAEYQLVRIDRGDEASS